MESTSLALDAAGHMALDDAILTHAPHDSVVLRFYEWRAPAVTFGYSQPYAVAQAAARERLPQAPLVRRATGGGVVFHDGDVTFSLVFPWERLSAACLIYKNIHRGVHVGLKAHGVLSSLWSPRVKAPVSDPLLKQCFSSPEPMDLVNDDGRKALGGALRRRGGRGLYQGSFRPEVLGAKDVAAAIAFGLSKEWEGLSTAIDDAWRDAGKALEKKYRSDSWNKRR